MMVTFMIGILNWFLSENIASEHFYNKYWGKGYQ